jgi:hypothetical protein
MLLSQLADNQAQLRRYFSTFALCVIMAPVLSSQIALLGHNLHWQIAYLIMCTIEVILLLTLRQLLPQFEKPLCNLDQQNFFSGYAYCIAKPYFVITSIITGICAALYFRVIMGNTHGLYILHFGVSLSHFSTVTLLLSSSFIIGLTCLNRLPNQIPGELTRLLGILCFLIATIILLFLHTALTITLGLCLVSLTMGFYMPLNSARGFSVIQHHQGSAAALYTFVFSLTSALLTLIQNHYKGPLIHFIPASLLICAIIITALCCLAITVRPRQH